MSRKKDRLLEEAGDRVNIVNVSEDPGYIPKKIVKKIIGGN